MTLCLLKWAGPGGYGIVGQLLLATYLRKFGTILPFPDIRRRPSYYPTTREVVASHPVRFLSHLPTLPGRMRGWELSFKIPGSTYRMGRSYPGCVLLFFYAVLGGMKGN